MENTYDVAIIGSGPGGYVSAIRCAQLGLKTTIIEKEDLGGVCLNWGCIPTKSLLASAKTYHNIIHSKDHGITISDVKVNITDIVARSRKIATKLSKGVSYLMKKNNINVIKGTAQCLDKNTLQIISDVNKTKISTKNIIIATGATAKDLPLIKADHQTIWNYRDALQVKKFPRSLLIAGSGAIGIEFACFFNSFGVEVTVIEAAPYILPTEDNEIAALAKKEYEKQGIRFVTSAMLEKSDVNQSGVDVVVNIQGTKKTYSAEKLLLAVGIKPQTEALGLDAIGIKTHKEHIVTNNHCQTNIPEIYAIGDVTNPPWLAHKASHEGIIAAETIAGSLSQRHLEATNIPGCIYAYPQVASIGLTEEKAKEDGKNVLIGRFPFSAVGKALAIGKPEGMVKVVLDKNTQEIIGVHMIGEEVTELINAISVAKYSEATGAELIGTVFAHPTLSEGIHEAFLDANKRAIHF